MGRAVLEGFDKFSVKVLVQWNTEQLNNQHCVLWGLLTRPQRTLMVWLELEPVSSLGLEIFGEVASCSLLFPWKPLIFWMMFLSGLELASPLYSSGYSGTSGITISKLGTKKIRVTPSFFSWIVRISLLPCPLGPPPRPAPIPTSQPHFSPLAESNPLYHVLHVFLPLGENNKNSDWLPSSYLQGNINISI